MAFFKRGADNDGQTKVPVTVANALTTNILNAYLPLILSTDEGEILISEIIKLAQKIEASGFNGNLATNDDTLQEIAQKLDDLTIPEPFRVIASNVAQASATPNVITITVAGVALYENNKSYLFTPLRPNTGQVTIAIDGLSHVSLRRSDGSHMESGDLGANRPVEITYVSAIGSFVATNIHAASAGAPTEAQIYTLAKSILVEGANVTLSYDDTTRRITIESTGGSGGSVTLTASQFITLVQGLNTTQKASVIAALGVATIVRADADEARIRRLETKTKDLIEKETVTWANATDAGIAIVDVSTGLGEAALVGLTYAESITISSAQVGERFLILRLPVDADKKLYRVRHTHPSASGHDTIVETPFDGSGFFRFFSTRTDYAYYVQSGRPHFALNDALQVQKTIAIQSEYVGALSSDEVVAALGGRAAPEASGARQLLRTNQAGDAYELLNADDVFFNFTFLPNPIQRSNVPTSLRGWLKVPAGAFPDATHVEMIVNGITSDAVPYNPNSNAFHAMAITLSASQRTSFNTVISTSQYMTVQVRLHHGVTTDYRYSIRVPVFDLELPAKITDLEIAGDLSADAADEIRSFSAHKVWDIVNKALNTVVRYMLASKDQVEDPNNETIYNYTPQRIHQAIDTILPGAEHGSIRPAGIEDLDSIAREYTVVIGAPSRLSARATHLDINFQGYFVHNAAWTASKRVFTFTISASNAALIKNDAARHANPDEIRVQIRWKSSASITEDNILDVLDLTVGVGHSALQDPDEPLALRWDQVHNENIEITAALENKWIASGWTIPTEGFYELFWDTEAGFDFPIYMHAQRMRTMLVAAAGGNARAVGVGARATSSITAQFARTSANILLVASSNRAGDPKPLNIRRIL